MAAWRLTVILTETQIRDLVGFAGPAALCPDKYGEPCCRALRAIQLGCLDLQKEIAKREAKSAALKKPCPWCGRTLMWGSPGRAEQSLPRDHKCPHGESCAPRGGIYQQCSACKAEPRMATREAVSR